MFNSQGNDVIMCRYPPSPAPGFVPHCSGRRTDQGLLKNMVCSFTYIWTERSGSFWFFPIYCSPGGVLSGYQWKRGGWEYAEIIVAQIVSFY